MDGMRDHRLELRLTGEERRITSEAATLAGETLSDFVRRAARDRAQEIILAQTQITLNDEEAARFLDALEHVDENTVARLRELLHRA